MKKIFFGLLIVLTGCTGEPLPISNNGDVSYDYTDVEDLYINAGEMFDVAESTYYVYFYSPYCTHCNMIKNTVIQYALENRPRFWFVAPGTADNLVGSPDININVGATKIDEVYLNGFPTMMQIDSQKIAKVFQGKSQILDELTIK